LLGTDLVGTVDRRDVIIMSVSPTRLEASIYTNQTLRMEAIPIIEWAVSVASPEERRQLVSVCLQQFMQPYISNNHHFSHGIPNGSRLGALKRTETRENTYIYI
jgi:hypothetical protein